MKDDSIFIIHISESVENIEKFVKGITKANFEKNVEKQYAVIRALEIIGEATKNVSMKLRKEHQNVPWKQMAGMRDRLIHHYKIIPENPFPFGMG